MIRFLLAATAATALMSSTAMADRDDKVGEIEGTMDLAAVTNQAAAKRFATTADDLKNALAVRLVDRLDEAGMKISVDLSEVELSNTYTDMVGAADTRLVGVITIASPDAALVDKYELTVDVNQARVFFPETVDMTNLTASSDAFYTAMIAAFADGVIKRIDG